MNFRIILVGLGILLGIQTLFGQPTFITGRILDYETNEPIEAITILEKYPLNGVITDSTGSFEFNIKGETKKIEINYIGYYDINLINIPIERDTIDLGELKMVRNYSLYIHVEMAPDIKPDNRRDETLRKDVCNKYRLEISNKNLIPVFDDRKIIFDFNK